MTQVYIWWLVLAFIYLEPDLAYALPWWWWAGGFAVLGMDATFTAIQSWQLWKLNKIKRAAP